eukprot:Rhum_TRINITY_DN13184_c0_g1::Rhum_TRINITY_DN13184_c0_g1_i3::g.57638::m.57638/K06268/PPP3R, CNB; serine/threonine-protein phosphatase 2B regulatory subunit
MSSFREQKGQKWIRSTRRPGASEVAKIKAKFALYDEDDDGGINTEEFKKMLSSLGIKLVSEDQMELFGEMDVDKSGKIEIGEFLDHYYTILQLVEEEEAKVMADLSNSTTFTRSEIEAMHANFKRISKAQNDDGLIDREEFALMMLNGKVASWDSFLLDGLFRMFDVDKSGGITFEEFVNSLSVYHNKVHKGNEERDRLMFQIYDVDNDGLLSHDDVSNVLTDCLNSNHLFLDKTYIDELVHATFKQGGVAKVCNTCPTPTPP